MQGIKKSTFSYWLHKYRNKLTDSPVLACIKSNMKRHCKSNSLETEDHDFISQALNENKIALENLINKHQNWIYNNALTMVSDSNDAADM